MTNREQTNEVANSARNSGAGRLYDIGYQRYQGDRGGRGSVLLALYIDGLRHSIGTNRLGRDKVIPWFSIGFILLGVTIVYLISALGGEFNAADLFGWQAFSIFVFIATVGTESISNDARYGTLSLYLTKPISSLDYIATRWSSVATSVFLLAFIPQLLYFLLSVLGSSNLGEQLGEGLVLIPAVLATSTAMAFFYATAAMAVGSATQKRIYAPVILLGTYFLGQIIRAIVTGLNSALTGVSPPEWVIFLHPARLPADLGDLMLLDRNFSAGLITAEIVLFFVLLILGWFFLVSKYRDLTQ